MQVRYEWAMNDVPAVATNTSAVLVPGESISLHMTTATRFIIVNAVVVDNNNDVRPPLSEVLFVFHSAVVRLAI